MRLNVAVEIPIFSATDLAGALNKKFSSIIKFYYSLYLNRIPRLVTLLPIQTYYIPIILLHWSTWSDVILVSIVVIRIRNRINSFRFSCLCEGVCVFCCNNRISPYFCLIFLSLLTKRPCFYVACSTKDADIATDIIAKSLFRYMI